MNEIGKDMSLKEFAIYVARELAREGIDVVLTGGAVVSIYSQNKYVSKDVDFISPDEHRAITNVMIKMGFESKGKDFFHPNSKFSVEFPGSTLMIGEELIKAEGTLKKGDFALKLLSPTQCVMDRLAAFYHWKDRQSLEQALLVAKSQPIDLAKVKKWSEGEGMLSQYKIFLDQLKHERKR